MASSGLSTTLSDVCDIRYQAISEIEGWSILYQGITTLREIFINGSAWKGKSPAFLITPDTLQLQPEGSVTFSASSKQMTHSAKHFLSPEILVGHSPATDKQLMTLYVFSLGAVVFWGLTYKELQSRDQLSDNMKNVLSKMIHKVPALRCTLEEVLEASTYEIGATQSGPPSSYIQKMAECLLGPSKGLNKEEPFIPEVLKYFPTAENMQPVTRSSAFQPVEPLNQTSQNHFKPTSDNIIHKPMPTKLNPTPPNNLPGFTPIVKQNPNPMDPYSMKPTFEKQGMMPTGSIGQIGHQIPHTSRPWNYDLPKTWEDPFAQTPMQPRVQNPPGNPMLHQNPANPYGDFNPMVQTNDPLLAEMYPQDGYPWDPNDISPLALSSPETRGAGRHNFQTRATSTTDFNDYINDNEPTFMPVSAKSVFDYPGVSKQMSHGQNTPAVKDRSPNTNISKGLTDKPLAQVSPKDVKPRQRPNSRKQDNKRLGPEFVFWSSQKPDSVGIPFQNEFEDANEDEKNSSKKRVVRVELPNGRKLDITCDVNSTVQDAFDAVVSHLNLVEHSFFGLTHFPDEEYYFLEFPEKLSDVAPETWRSGMASQFTLYFQVKFYSNDIGELKDASTRHYFYLQLRKDLLHDKYDCSEDFALILGSLAMQAEYGDFAPHMSRGTYFKTEHYITQSIITFLGSDHVHSTLLELHKANAGLSPDEAEGRMVMQCSKINDYGRHYHKLFASEDTRATYPVQLGISTVGIDCWKLDDEDEGIREKLYFFTWKEIKSVSLKKRKFMIETFVEDEPPLWEYLTDSARKGKYLLQLCSSHYKFQDAVGETKSTTEPTNQNQGETSQSNGITPSAPEYQSNDAMNEGLGNSPRRESQNQYPKKPSRGDSTIEREMNVIRISKTPPNGELGIVVGEKAEVVRIIPGSAAAYEKNILPGDRIIAANGRSFEGLDSNEINDYLQVLGQHVDLIVSQPMRPNKLPQTPQNTSSGMRPSKMNPSANRNKSRDPSKTQSLKDPNSEDPEKLYINRSNTVPQSGVPQGSANFEDSNSMYGNSKRRSAGVAGSQAAKPEDKLLDSRDAFLPDFRSDETGPPESVKPFDSRELMPTKDTDKASWKMVKESDLMRSAEISSLSNHNPGSSKSQPHPVAAPRKSQSSSNSNNPKSYRGNPSNASSGRSAHNGSGDSPRRVLGRPRQRPASQLSEEARMADSGVAN